ncbi:MAG TPA: hypothetical protein ENN54_04405 [Thermoplasmatales archaeon]|nr:hypothetical protein [Thermoplasmatales archaeon]
MIATAVMLMMVAAPSIVAVQESDSPSQPLTLEGAKPKEMSIRPLGPVTAGNTGETLISVNSPEDDHLPALTEMETETPSWCGRTTFRLWSPTSG